MVINLKREWSALWACHQFRAACGCKCRVGRGLSLTSVLILLGDYTALRGKGKHVIVDHGLWAGYRGKQGMREWRMMSFSLDQQVWGRIIGVLLLERVSWERGSVYQRAGRMTLRWWRDCTDRWPLGQSLAMGMRGWGTAEARMWRGGHGAERPVHLHEWWSKKLRQKGPWRGLLQARS